MIPYLSKLGISIGDLRHIPCKLFTKMIQRFNKQMNAQMKSKQGVKIATQEDMDNF